MKFPLTSIDKEQYFKKITDLLNDDEALLFIDTNILATFYKLNAEARKELLDWMKTFTAKDRLKTPTWALNEYTKRFVRKRTNDYLSAGTKLKTIKKEFKELRKFLTMHIDEENLKVARYAGRSAYMEDLSKVSDTLEKLSNSLKNKTAAYIVEINDALQGVLETTVIESDIFKLVEPIGNSGQHRFRTELPPGFEDGDKDFNAYGDLIIWQEILAYSKARQRKKVLILTNDQKPDWMYAPYQLLVKGRKIPNGEPELKIADPRLIYEFRLATFSEELYIINLETLTQIFIENNSKDLILVARALQQVNEGENPTVATGATVISDVVDEAGEPHADEVDAQPEEVDTAPDEAAAEPEEGIVAAEGRPIAGEVARPEKQHTRIVVPITYSQEALADVMYQNFKEPRIGHIVEKLKSQSWYTQNPAIEELVDFLNSFATTRIYPDDLFVLGRNIYQAASGGAYSAMDLIEHKLARLNLPSKFRGHIVAGMFYEIYFNNQGAFRHGNLKSYLLSGVFKFQTDPDFADAVRFIQYSLQDYLAELFVLPDQKPQVVAVELFVEETETNWAGSLLAVKDVKINGESVLKYSDLYYHNKFKQVSGESNVKEHIESVFGVPVDQQVLKNNLGKDHPYLFDSNAILWRGDLPQPPVIDDLDF